jgi:sterol desaturase/sphingolipid hydroxylase (fatty acid hydroxylase superfamily)
MAFIVPIHLFAALALLSLMSVVAVLNHAGWEVLPRRFLVGSVGGQLISATHHSYHHIRFDRNYGRYFRFWDKFFCTDAMPAIAPSASDGAGRPSPRSYFESRGRLRD